MVVNAASASIRSGVTAQPRSEVCVTWRTDSHPLIG